MTRLDKIRHRLQVAREQAGLSQSQVARLIGVDSPSTISHWETGAQGRGIDLERFIQLCEVYDVDETWVLTGINPNFDRNKLGEMMTNTVMGFHEAMELLDTRQE